MSIDFTISKINFPATTACDLKSLHGQDAWMRVNDGFITADAPFKCVPKDIEYPNDRSEIWEDKVNEYDALDSFEPTDDPLLAPPPLYDHQDVVVEDEVKKEKDPRKVRFAPNLEDVVPHRSGTDDQRGIPYLLSDRDASGKTYLYLMCLSRCTSTAHADN
eukprot:460877-Amphidinium_carterae.1